MSVWFQSFARPWVSALAGPAIGARCRWLCSFASHRLHIVRLDILINCLHTVFGFNIVAPGWFSTYLGNRTFFSINTGTFSYVPHGSILGPVLLSLDIEYIIQNNNISFHYTYNIQLYLTPQTNRLCDLNIFQYYLHVNPAIVITKNLGQLSEHVKPSAKYFSVI